MVTSPAEYSAFLSHSQLFHGVSAEALQDLIKQGKIISAAASTNLLREDESQVGGLYTVLEGSVQIVKAGHPLTRLGRGSFFGEISIFGMALGATATVSTPEGCTVLMTPLSTLQSWFKQHPQAELPFYRHLAAELCRRLYSTTAKLA